MKRQCGASPPAGFSLMEIMVVIVLLAIAAAIVIPRIGSAADSQAVSAARVLKSDLEVARSLAVATQQPHSLVFSPDGQSYKVVANYTGGPYSSAVAVAHPVVAQKTFEVHLASQNGMSQVTVVSASFGGATYVTFNAQGDPSAAGVVTIRAGSTQMQVVLAGLTGTVTTTRIGG
jgi:prepilin-type N-terminal cleavage/methylation domain-containing protein